MKWFQKLKSGLQRSSNKITEGITAVIKKRKLNQDVLDELEELLISADLGINMAARFTNTLSKNRFNQEITDQEIRQALAEEVVKVLEPVTIPLAIDSHHCPHIILVVGVNGSGKTTTIGKLAKLWQSEGHQVRLVAGDTFRAAAVEQLQQWGKRLNVPVESGALKADAASLAFESIERSKKEKDDVLIIDTAGRLHNKSNLMEELSKILRVIKKVDSSAPHSCLLVLDATTGQNIHSQVEIFAREADINGLIMTKLDGTARGGVLVSIAEKFSYPIHAIGVGEGEDDLQPFQASSFARSLVGLE